MKRKIISVCYLLIVISLIIIVDLKIKNNSVNIFNEGNISTYSETVKDKLVGQIKDEYVGILEIKKIKLKRGFYSIDSNKNNVDKNIMVISSSDMPDVNLGNLILASHSGNSNISYFKNLDKLEIGDIASVYYLKNKYDYKLVNYYEVDKTGVVQIIKNNDVNCLTLITCKKNTNKQLVFIFELENVI